MNVRNQQQLPQAKPAQATSKAGPSKAEQLKSGRMMCVPETATDVAYLVCADGKSAVVQFDLNGVACAVVFAGASAKKAWGYSFHSADRRADRVTDWMMGQDGKHAAKLAEQALRKATPHTLTVGSILYASWGYDQTNVDFYEVVAVRGAAVDLREISKTRQMQGSDHGTCVANPGQFMGEVIKGKRPDRHNCVRISSCQHASPWSGKPLHWSSWH